MTEPKPAAWSDLRFPNTCHHSWIPSRRTYAPCSKQLRWLFMPWAIYFLLCRLSLWFLVLHGLHCQRRSASSSPTSRPSSRIRQRPLRLHGRPVERTSAFRHYGSPQAHLLKIFSDWAAEERCRLLWMVNFISSEPLAIASLLDRHPLLQRAGIGLRGNTRGSISLVLQSNLTSRVRTFVTGTSSSLHSEPTTSMEEIQNPPYSDDLTEET